MLCEHKHKSISGDGIGFCVDCETYLRGDLPIDIREFNRVNKPVVHKKPSATVVEETAFPLFDPSERDQLEAVNEIAEKRKGVLSELAK